MIATKHCCEALMGYIKNLPVHCTSEAKSKIKCKDRGGLVIKLCKHHMGLGNFHDRENDREVLEQYN